MILATLGLCTSLFLGTLEARTLETNALEIRDAPPWVKRTKVEKVIDSIQQDLEWSTRRIPLIWHNSKKSFAKAHSLRPLPLAVTIKSTKKTEIHMGPEVTSENYLQVLGHELVHVIFYQKYRGVIPRWLEEGFANHLSRKTKVDYKWLKKQKLPQDVRSLSHPFKKKGPAIFLHYKVSQALVEMLKKKCDLTNLLRLSVQRKIEKVIQTYCEIQDINHSFQRWVVRKSKEKS